MITEFEFLEYLRGTGIPIREKNDKVLLEYCPYCESDNKKSPFTHFAFFLPKMGFNCVKCGAKGNLYRFKLDRGDVQPITRARPIQYRKPDPDKSLTENREDAYQWYQDQRGICVEILKKYEVGFHRRDGKPVIVYQYFDENKVLVNRKYRSPDKKTIWTEKDAEKIYYGLQHVNFGEDTLHVCEGEDDCHALTQMGIDNVVSVPFGAATYTPAMDRINKRFKSIIMLFDNDPRGQEGARSFAEKAGALKCRNVVLPYKDARDCLLEGLDIFDIQTEIVKSRQIKHENIIKAGDTREMVKKAVFDSNKIVGHMTPIGELNRVLGGVRMGELSIGIGQTGSGKSTFAYNMAAWMEQAGLPVLILPFENRIESVVRKFVEIYSGESIYTYDYAMKSYQLDKSQQWVDEQIDRLEEKNLFFLNKRHRSKNGYFDTALVQNIIEYAVKFYDVKFIVLDHLHYFLRLSNSKHPNLVIEETMRMIKQWTDDYNCHIFMNVHPHMTDDSRTGKAAKLGLNSSKGSSSISQECDNYMVVERPEKDKGDREVLASRVRVEKNREVGITGPVLFSVLPNRNTYVEYSLNPHTNEQPRGKEAACADF